MLVKLLEDKQGASQLMDLGGLEPPQQTLAKIELIVERVAAWFERLADDISAQELAQRRLGAV